MKTKNIFILAAAALMATSCSNDETPNGTVVADSAIRIQTNVNDIAASRAGQTANSLSEFGIFVTNTANNNYTYRNVKMKKNGTAWDTYMENETTIGQMLWQNSTQSVDVVAYAPYQSGQTLTASLSGSVSTDQNTNGGDTASDLLYAKSTVTPDANDASTAKDIYYKSDVKSMWVNFNHLLSKIRVNIRYATEYTGNGASPKPSIGNATLKNTKTAWTMDWTAGSASVPASATSPNDIVMKKETAFGYEAVVVPQSTTFTVSLEVGAGKLSYNSTRSYTFEAGTLYTVNLVVGKDRVTLGTITAVPWDEVSGGKLTTL